MIGEVYSPYMYSPYAHLTTLSAGRFYVLESKILRCL